MERIRSTLNNFQTQVNNTLGTNLSTPRLLVGITGLTLSVYYGIKKIKMHRRYKYLESLGKEVVKELNTKHHNCLELVQKIDEKLRAKILKMSGAEIRKQIILGEISCADVLLTFAQQAHKMGKIYNCLIEEHYDSAFIEAQKLDDILHEKRLGEEKKFYEYVESKPLLGIPICIKDMFVMKDSRCTNGLLALSNIKYGYDGEVVTAIRESGGIPFVKTNIPQLLMVPETDNRIIGLTLNPVNTKRTCGGSSGGDAALVASKGCLLGIGSDIGGSLRIPAHFCGVSTFKPSTDRATLLGRMSIQGRYWGKRSIRSSYGPIAQNVDDIILCMQAFFSDKIFKHDPYIFNGLSFNNNLFNSKNKLNIGYYVHDGWFDSCPTVKRAIDIVIDVLKNAYGHNIIPVTFGRGPKVIELYLKYTGAAGNMRDFEASLQGEPFLEQYKILKQLSDIPNTIRYILQYLLPLVGEQRRAFISRCAKNGGFTVVEERNIAAQLMQFRDEFWKWYDSLNDGKGVDIMIAPVCFYPAMPIGFSKNLAISLTSTVLQNILDCPCGAFGPVTTVGKDECYYNTSNNNGNNTIFNENDALSKEIDAAMKKAEGLPVSVQIYAKPFHDEVVLRVMKELESCIKQ